MRIDHILTRTEWTESGKGHKGPSVLSCDIHPSSFGSDHRPIVARIDLAGSEWKRPDENVETPPTFTQSFAQHPGFHHEDDVLHSPTPDTEVFAYALRNISSFVNGTEVSFGDQDEKSGDVGDSLFEESDQDEDMENKVDEPILTEPLACGLNLEPNIETSVPSRDGGTSTPPRDGGSIRASAATVEEEREPEDQDDPRHDEEPFPFDMSTVRSHMPMLTLGLGGTIASGPLIKNGKVLADSGAFPNCITSKARRMSGRK